MRDLHPGSNTAYLLGLSQSQNSSEPNSHSIMRRIRMECFHGA